MISARILWIAALCWITAAPRTAIAQHDTTSTVLGTVKDSLGHPVSGVEVYMGVVDGAITRMERARVR